MNRIKSFLCVSIALITVLSLFSLFFDDNDTRLCSEAASGISSGQQCSYAAMDKACFSVCIDELPAVKPAPRIYRSSRGRSDIFRCIRFLIWGIIRLISAAFILYCVIWLPDNEIPLSRRVIIRYIHSKDGRKNILR